VKTRNASDIVIEEEVRIGVQPHSRARRAFVGKLALLGDSGVGKTQFATALQSPYDETFVSIDHLPGVASTSGVQFTILQMAIGTDTLYRMQVWDTAGQERFHSMLPMYTRDSAGIILMYDIADQKTFDSIEERWIPFIEEHIRAPQPPIMLVGNKLDLDYVRAISQRQAQQFAFARGWHYAETTALFRATVHKAAAELCAHMFYASMRLHRAREIVITPEMLQMPLSRTTAATTTKTHREILAEQESRRRKGACCY